MIVIVAGDGSWPKVKDTLDYFHHRDRYTLVIADSGAAKRWALERGVRLIEQDPVRALDRRDYGRVHVIGRGGVVSELARQRGRKVVETA